MITLEISVPERPKDKVCPKCGRKYHHSFKGDYCSVDKWTKLELEKP